MGERLMRFNVWGERGGVEYEVVAALFARLRRFVSDTPPPAHTHTHIHTQDNVQDIDDSGKGEKNGVCEEKKKEKEGEGRGGGRGGGGCTITRTSSPVQAESDTEREAKRESESDNESSLMQRAASVLEGMKEGGRESRTSYNLDVTEIEIESRGTAPHPPPHSPPVGEGRSIEETVTPPTPLSSLVLPWPVHVGASGGEAGQGAAWMCGCKSCTLWRASVTAVTPQIYRVRASTATGAAGATEGATVAATRRPATQAAASGAAATQLYSAATEMKEGAGGMNVRAFATIQRNKLEQDAGWEGGGGAGG